MARPKSAMVWAAFALAVSGCGNVSPSGASVQGASTYAGDGWTVLKSAVSPDGKHVAAWAYPPQGAETVAVRDVPSGSWRQLAAGAPEMSDVVWADDSNGLYVTQGTKGQESVMFWRIGGGRLRQLRKASFFPTTTMRGWHSVPTRGSWRCP